MPIFGATLCCKSSYLLQNRLSSFLWVKKNGATVCLQGRVFSSSAPVRYIPKQKRESQTCPSVASSVGKEPSKGLGSSASGLGVSRGDSGGQRTFVSNDESWNLSQNRIEIMPMNDLIIDDAELALGEEFDHNVEASDFEGELEEVVEEGNFCTQKDHHDRNVLQISKTKRQTENMAVKLLATRALTAVELQNKLHAKQFSADIIEGVIKDLQGRGYINHCSFAEAYSRTKWYSSSWGPRRIKFALLKKGISGAAAENAVTRVFKEGESVGDQESALGFSKLSMDHLFAQASKKWLRSQNVPRNKQISRIVFWLQYRGFNWGVIRHILEKLTSQYPP